MPSQNILDNPYIKAALAQKQQQDAIAQQQQQAYLNKLAQIDTTSASALSEIDAYANSLPEPIRMGAGVQWELNAERKRAQKQAKLSKLQLDPSAKGVAEMRGIINDEYPDRELQPFESTDTYKQASQMFTRINDDYRIADLLNEQLGTLGNILIQSKEAKDENTKNALRQDARQYAITSIAQNLANASQPNAQQLNEFLRAAPDLLTPEQVGILGGNWRAIFGSAVDKFRTSKPNSEERVDAASTLAKVFSADPENWYKIAQLANKDFMSRKSMDLREKIVSKVGPWHADEMGARKPVVNDPLAEYMAKSQKAPQQEYGAPLNQSGALTITTGAGTSIPVQSGSMQAGTVSSGTVMPTSRPRTKFTVLTPQ